MTKFFDGKKLADISKRRNIFIAVFVCCGVVLIAAAILFAVFCDKIGRAAAQTVSTVCVCAVACLSVIFADYMLFYKKVSALCKAKKTEETGTVQSVSQQRVTYRAFSCLQAEILTENGEERRMYLFEGELQSNVKYKFEVAQNIICGYEEEQ